MATEANITTAAKYPKPFLIVSTKTETFIIKRKDWAEIPAKA